APPAAPRLLPYTTLFRSRRRTLRLVDLPVPLSPQSRVHPPRSACRSSPSIIGVASQPTVIALRSSASMRSAAGSRSKHSTSERRSEEHTSELLSRFDLVC